MVDGYGKQLRKVLREHGWRLHRQGKGDHEVWIGPHGGVKVSIDAGTRSKVTAQGILKKAGIEVRL